MSGFFKNLYFKSIESCGHPRAPWILGVLSFTESCFFIIPPEVLLLPMCYAKRAMIWFYVLITTLASVAGALAGYLMGKLLWEEIGPLFFHYIPGFARYFDIVGEQYGENAITALFLAAFTPIPFKVFTVAAGVYSHQVGIPTLLITSLIGRGLRYFIMAGLIYFLGERAKHIIEKYFKTFLILLALAAIGVVLIKIFYPGEAGCPCDLPGKN